MIRYTCLRIFVLVMLLGSIACTGSKKSATTDSTTNRQVEFIILQMNDVYELSPQENGKVGGLARVATLRKQLLRETPHVLTVLAGDFLSPSLLGTLKLDGERIKGRQMVEVMNALGLDLVAFGNHEFDLKEDELQKRINESRFVWLTTNIQHKTDGKLEPFYKYQEGKRIQMPKGFTWNIRYDEEAEPLKVGFYSACINDNTPDYVYFDDPYQSAEEIYLHLYPKVDVLVGLTHLELVMDLKLASMLVKSALIMGGHEHDNSIDTVGTVVVAKADANAKSVYVHRFKYDLDKKTYELNSSLVRITDEIAADPEIDALVKKWERIMLEQISQVVDNPSEVIYNAHVPLDGREKSIRNRQTNLGQLIAASMAFAAKKPVDGAILNSGSVRIDDQLAGPITPVEIFRSLPYGGQLYEVEMTGKMLKRTLDAGWENKGLGGFLQWHNINRTEDGNWIVGGKALDLNRNYRIVMGDYLWKGLEAGLEFLNTSNLISWETAADGDETDLRSDVRKAVVAYLKTLK
ncbi:MAG: 5'-nucleotidase C-terminal domain-containing protein [Saprospiraceae bacterium]